MPPTGQIGRWQPVIAGVSNCTAWLYDEYYIMVKCLVDGESTGELLHAPDRVCM